MCYQVHSSDSCTPPFPGLRLLALFYDSFQADDRFRATAYCAIANGGTLYQPQIVNKIVNGSGDSATIVKQFSPVITRKSFIDSENLDIVREGMHDGVTKSYGGSSILNDLPISVAAKTGTAQIGVENHYNVWSSVFAPYDNPEIVLVVTVENVQGFGAVTLPVAHDVLSWYFGK